MPTAADYHIVRDGAWRLLVLPDSWSSDLQNRVLALARDQVPAKHPQTIRFNWPDCCGTSWYYLKVFHRPAGIDVVKDFSRMSKALRFWSQGLALSAAGFHVPLTIAAGELRGWRFLQRAFVLTAEVVGRPLPMFLADLSKIADRRKYFQVKRDGVARLAHIIREFHRQRFVHGDMVASNLVVSEIHGKETAVFFMDNDRTRRYPAWLANALWRRNLIQLNRMPLPGITLQDRFRFLHGYFSQIRFSSADRRFARWLETKTRKRRSECDGVDPSGNFRKLMRWKTSAPSAEEC